MIRSATLYSYEIPRILPQQAHRKGIVIQWTHIDGDTVWSETSPLPLWSVETFEDALKQLMLLIPKLKYQPCAKVLTTLPSHLFPSVHFGICSAMNYFLSDRICERLSLPISGLLLGSYSEILKQISLLDSSGFVHVKLKTSQLSVDEAIWITQHLKKKYKLRIDMNQNWKPNECMQYLKNFSESDFDYIEEPPTNCQLTSFPIALDESLRMMEPISLPSLGNLRAIVIKPTLSKILFSTPTLISEAVSNGKIVSLSSSFESGIGLYHIGRLAKHLSLTSFPLGLDTNKYFCRDLLVTPHHIQGGMVDLSFPKPNINLLKKIADV
ncbi:MAG: hypothetical protein EBZ47_02650 [Chlamydiae bacterium]|nr:hypothetical protein [Chlamydiota bacterium]